MTAIVAIKKDGRVWMGADSMTNGLYVKESRRTPKVFKNGPFLMGFAGSPRIQQVLQYTLKVPDNASIAIEHLVKEFIPAVKDLLDEAGATIINEAVMVSNSTFLIAGRSSGFFGTADVVQVDINFQVIDHLVDYWAIGSGAETALGSLFSTRGDPVKRIRKALRAAERHTIYVERPFTILEL